MGLFSRNNQEPSEAFAAEEQNRADGLATTIAHIQANPKSALKNSVPLYQAAYQNASGNAAAHTKQPKTGRHFT